MIWINALEEEEPRRPAYHDPLPAKSTFGEMRASDVKRQARSPAPDRQH